jgi:hypothetical protein
MTMSPMLALLQTTANLAFVAGTFLTGSVLGAALFFGITRWPRPTGKAFAIVSGILFLALVAFVALVLILDWSARHGSPI